MQMLHQGENEQPSMFDTNFDARKSVKSCDLDDEEIDEYQQNLQ